MSRSTDAVLTVLVVHGFCGSGGGGSQGQTAAGSSSSGSGSEIVIVLYAVTAP